jgi:DNA-binding response OmpR family regulator
MAKVLIVDDDLEMLEMLTGWLQREHHVVETATNGLLALNLMKSFGFDVIVLDWELPGFDGPSICKSYREGGGKVPILMLTGKGAIEEKEKGFRSGADDYLTKPFHPKELSLRILALLGRSSVQPDKNTLVVKDLILDRAGSSVKFKDTLISLTSREFSLLEFLMRHPKQTFTAEALIVQVWKSDAEVSDRAVRTCISRLRDKFLHLDKCPQIKTLPGFGYMLDFCDQQTDE